MNTSVRLLIHVGFILSLANARKLWFLRPFLVFQVDGIVCLESRSTAFNFYFNSYLLCTYVWAGFVIATHIKSRSISLFIYFYFIFFSTRIARPFSKHFVILQAASCCVRLVEFLLTVFLFNFWWGMSSVFFCFRSLWPLCFSAKPLVQFDDNRRNVIRTFLRRPCGQK